MTKSRKTTSQPKKVTPEMENTGTTTNDQTSQNTESVETGSNLGSETVIQDQVSQDSSSENADTPVILEEKVVTEEQPIKSSETVVSQSVPELPVIEVQKSAAELQEELFCQIETEVDRILKDCSLVRKSQFEIIKSYIRNMAPRKPMDVSEGKRHQATLAITLNAILNMPDTDGDYNKSLTALLRVFELASKSTLSEPYAFRFLESVEMTNDKIDEFTRILNLLIVLGPRDGRKDAIRQIDFNKSLRLGFSDEARQRILAYFNM